MNTGKKYVVISQEEYAQLKDNSQPIISNEIENP